MLQCCCPCSEKFKKVEKLFWKGYLKYVYLEEKRYHFIFTFLKSVSHFLKKLISIKEKVFLHHQKRFSQEKKSDQTKRKEMFFYTPLLRVFFTCFQGQKIIWNYLKNIVVSALKSCIKWRWESPKKFFKI